MSAAVLTGIKVRRDRCGAYLAETGRCCNADAPYVVYFTGCPPCIQGRGYSTCRGHGVCDEHAIHARNGNRRSYVDGSRLAVHRIRSQGGAQ